MVLGGYRLECPYAQMEPEDNIFEIPIDGIIDTGVLTAFDLWFDYDNGIALR